MDNPSLSMGTVAQGHSGSGCVESLRDNQISKETPIPWCRRRSVIPAPAAIEPASRHHFPKVGLKLILRRFSSPLLSAILPGGFAADDGKKMPFDDQESSYDQNDGIRSFRKRRLMHEQELVSRSFSLRIDDDGDAYESFCPSDFEVQELLGKGFFGEVFKVIHRTTGQPMVLKKLYRSNSKCERDFVKEAAVMRRLHHPNVLRFMGVLYKDRKLHLITEYVSGGTLRQLLDSAEVLDWNGRVSIAKDVASGMVYLHSKNIIHRDLNSGNILIRQGEGECGAVVADFGLARMLGQRRNQKYRRLTVVGNPYLMAPEMAMEENYNELVDVFSYGITLCEIIGRCTSDPDILHRRKDFGIDEEYFLCQFVDDTCPRAFLNLAFKCAVVNAIRRPPFSVVRHWLDGLLANLLSQDDHACEEIAADIERFAGCDEVRNGACSQYLQAGH